MRVLPAGLPMGIMGVAGQFVTWRGCEDCGNCGITAVTGNATIRSPVAMSC